MGLIRAVTKRLSGTSSLLAKTYLYKVLPQIPNPFGSFQKLGLPYLGVLIIRILLFRVL